MLDSLNTRTRRRAVDLEGEAMLLDDLVQRACGLVEGNDRAILGIAGAPGSGKSTLAEALLARLRTSFGAHRTDSWVAHVPMDGFHLADAELVRLGRRERKGAPDTFDVLGYVALLRRVRAATHEVVYAPGFSRTVDQPIAGSVPIYPEARLIITEGNYLLLPTNPWPAVAQELDETWFCLVPRETRVDRLITRHEAFGKTSAEARAWALGSDQRNAELVEPTAARADLVVSMQLFELDGPG